MELAVRRPGIHVSQTSFHGFVWEHGNVLEAQRLEDMLLEVIVERQTSHPLDTESCKIDADLRCLLACAGKYNHRTAPIEIKYL
jgi:hypothetical protein